MTSVLPEAFAHHRVQPVRSYPHRLLAALRAPTPRGANTSSCRWRPRARRRAEVATGRDYGDVAPLSGVFTGGKTSDMFVSVEMTRLA